MQKTTHTQIRQRVVAVAAATVLGVAGGLGIAACGDDDVKDATESIKQGAEDVSSTVKEGAEDVGNAAEEGAQDVEDAVNGN